MRTSRVLVVALAVSIAHATAFAQDPASGFPSDEDRDPVPEQPSPADAPPSIPPSDPRNAPNDRAFEDAKREGHVTGEAADKGYAGLPGSDDVEDGSGGSLEDRVMRAEARCARREREAADARRACDEAKRALDTWRMRSAQGSDSSEGGRLANVLELLEGEALQADQALALARQQEEALKKQVEAAAAAIEERIGQLVKEVFGWMGGDPDAKLNETEQAAIEAFRQAARAYFEAEADAAAAEEAARKAEEAADQAEREAQEATDRAAKQAADDAAEAQRLADLIQRLEKELADAQRAADSYGTAASGSFRQGHMDNYRTNNELAKQKQQEARDLQKQIDQAKQQQTAHVAAAGQRAQQGAQAVQGAQQAATPARQAAGQARQEADRAGQAKQGAQGAAQAAYAGMQGASTAAQARAKEEAEARRQAELERERRAREAAEAPSTETDPIADAAEADWDKFVAAVEAAGGEDESDLVAALRQSKTAIRVGASAAKSASAAAARGGSVGCGIARSLVGSVLGIAHGVYLCKGSDAAKERGIALFNDRTAQMLVFMPLLDGKTTAFVQHGTRAYYVVKTGPNTATVFLYGQSTGLQIVEDVPLPN